MKNPRNLNVFAEIEGKIAERVSPNRTTNATLYRSALIHSQIRDSQVSDLFPCCERVDVERDVAHLSANNSRQNL